MFKAIIFDVDGTLSETEEIHRKAFNKAFEMKNLPWHWDLPAYRQLLRVSGGKERIRHFMETHDSHRLATARVDDWILDLHRCKTRFYTQMIEAGEAGLRPGIREFIIEAAAKGIRLAIATTTSMPNVEALLHSAFDGEGVALFEVICAGDSVPNKKPAPDIFLLALEMLGLGASDCVAIEDSRNGLLSAYNAGIATIVTPSIFTDDQSFDEATLVTKDLTGLSLATAFATTCGRKKAGG